MESHSPIAKKYFTFLSANSDYDPKGSEDPQYQFDSLPSTLTDLASMRKGLAPTLFDLENNPPTVAKNYSKDQFNDAWMDWLVEVVAASKNGEVVALFYYSGHGVIFAEEQGDQPLTHMVHKDARLEALTPIENMLRKLSLRPNIMVISFLDCCRKKVMGTMTKGAKTVEPLPSK